MNDGDSIIYSSSGGLDFGNERGSWLEKREGEKEKKNRKGRGGKRGLRLFSATYPQYLAWIHVEIDSIQKACVAKKGGKKESAGKRKKKKKRKRN